MSQDTEKKPRPLPALQGLLEITGDGPVCTTDGFCFDPGELPANEAEPKTENSSKPTEKQP